MELTIHLTEEDAQRLQMQARQLGVDLEELASSLVTEHLSVPADEEFERVAKSVLDRYAELYKRLA